MCKVWKLALASVVLSLFVSHGAGAGENPLTVTKRHFANSKVLNFELYGIQLYMYYDDVLSVIRKRHKGKRSESFLKYQSSREKGVIYFDINKSKCVKDKLLTEKTGTSSSNCYRRMKMIEVFDKGEEISVWVEFIEDPKNLGRSMVIGVGFDHKFGRMRRSFDPLKIAKEKYGQSDYHVGGTTGYYWFDAPVVSHIDKSRDEPHLLFAGYPGANNSNKYGLMLSLGRNEKRRVNSMLGDIYLKMYGATKELKSTEEPKF